MSGVCSCLYPQLMPTGQALLDHKYPCGDGGWIHYRVTCQAQLEEIQMILTAKCAH